MKRGKIISIITAFLLIFVCIQNKGFCKEKMLHLSIGGANTNFKPTNIIKGARPNATLHTAHISTPVRQDISFELELMEKMGSYSSDDTIFEVNIIYPETIRNMGSVREIAQESYSPEALELIGTAANEIAQLINYFSEKYPRGMITATTCGMGAEVILQTISKNIPKLTMIMLYFPPKATVSKDSFIKTLRNNGYTQIQVHIFARSDDPTIPLLENIYNSNSDLLNYVIVENEKF